MTTVATMYFYATLHKLMWVNFEIGLNVIFFIYYKSTDASALGFFFIYYLGHHMHLCIKINNSEVIIYNQ